MLLLLGAEVAIGFVHFAARHYVAHFVGAVAGIENSYFIHHRALHHAAVGALDESVFVDPRKTR